MYCATELRHRTVMELTNAGVAGGVVRDTPIGPTADEDLAHCGVMVWSAGDQMSNATRGQGVPAFDHAQRLTLFAWAPGATGPELAAALDALVMDILEATIANPAWYAPADGRAIERVESVQIDTRPPDENDRKRMTATITLTLIVGSEWPPSAPDALETVAGAGGYGIDLAPGDGEFEAEFNVELPQE